MGGSAFALWLDSTFASFDERVLAAVHGLQQSGADRLLGPLSRLFAVLGSGGVALILLGLGLLVFRRTRRYGAAVLLALAVGALFTNVLIKPLAARARPYADQTRLLYRWWLEAGAMTESDASFPSGHATACTAAMSAIFFLGDKRRSWLYLLPALFMAFTRLYLVVHYPTDVIAGFLIGFAAGAAASWFVKKDIEKRARL